MTVWKEEVLTSDISKLDRNQLIGSISILTNKPLRATIKMFETSGMELLQEYLGLLIDLEEMRKTAKSKQSQ